MKPALRDEWIAALRSGDYAQGRGALRKGDKFCCLGVLCDVIGLEWIPQTPPHADTLYEVSRHGWEDIVPESISEDIELRMNTQKHLTQWNDTGVPFTQIADWIERNL